MTNGKIPTWFAVKWLCEHHAHSADVVAGGKTDPFLNLHYCVIHRAIEGDTDRVEDRDDWTLVDENSHRIPDSELSQCE